MIILRRDNAGFTLIEVLISMVILVVIMSIVYASFSSVVNSVEAARVDAEEMRLRQFFVRSLMTNFSTVYVPQDDPEAYSVADFQFLGVNETDSHGHADSIRFISSAPIVGGGAMPGDTKEVKYEILSDEDEDAKLFDSAEDDADKATEGETYRDRLLQTTETPLAQGNVQVIDEQTGGELQDLDTDVENPYVAPTWSVPIETLDLLYFDGEEWREEWDSTVEGRMPWAIHVKINFAKPESMRDADKEAGYDLNDDPDFETIVSIPIGMNVFQDQRQLLGGLGGNVQNGQNNNDDDDNNNNNDNNSSNDNNNDDNNSNNNNDSNSSNTTKPDTAGK